MFVKVLFIILFLFLTSSGNGSPHLRKHIQAALRVPYNQAVKHARLPKPKVEFHVKPSFGRRMLDDQDFFAQEVGHTRSLPDLPSLADLLSGKISLENGVNLNYEGCEIAVKAEGKEYTLDLTNPKCKDFVSFKTFFSKFVKEPDESTDRFLSLDKFDVEKISVNIEKKVVSFSAKSKEPFQFMLGVDLKVSGSLKLSFNYEDLSFKGLGLDINGDIKIGATTIKYSLTKKENSEEGSFSLTADSIAISDFYKAFTGNSELDDNEVGSKAFADAKVDNPMIKGTRDKAGNSELVLSATATGIPGLSKGSFIVLISAPYGKNAEVGVLVDLQEISPAEILTKLTPMDVSEVPVLSDLKINVLIEYANADMTPKDPEALKMVKKYSKTGTVNNGLKLKFEMPFEEILKKHGATPPPNTNLRPELTVMFKDGKVNFEFPPDAPMDIINIAIAFVPGFAKAALDKVFDEPPQIKVNKFEIDIKDGSVDVDLEAVGKIGFKMLSLDSLKFALKHKAQGPWDFTFEAVKMVGACEMKLHVSKKGDVYHMKGDISRLTTSDIADTFSVDSTVGKALKSLKSLNIGLMDVKLEMTFGELINAKFLGKLTFLGFEAIFEGYVVQVAPGVNAMAFGIVVTNVGVADLVTKMFKEDMGKDVEIMDQKWMSQVTISVIFANKEATEKVKFADKSLLAAKKPTDLGVSFSADVAIPADCGKEQLCELISKALGPGAHLILNGVFQNGKIELSAEFTGSIKIGDKFTIEKAGFMIKAGIESSPEFSIYGQATLDVQEEKGIVFKAKLGLTAAMTVSLSLTMENWLKNPFGIKYLEIGNFNLLAAINVITAVPAFSLSGQLRIGNPDKAIQADLAGGFDGTSGKFYVYAKFTKLTLKSTLEAFDMDPEKVAKIPPSIADSGFPEGFVAGIAMPTAVEIPNMNVKLEPGFFLKGKVALIGFTIAAEIKVNFPSITVKAKFDKISLAGGIVQLTKVDDRNAGPEFELALGAKKLSIKINAYIEAFGIGVGAEISITHEKVFFQITGNFLNLFQITLKVSAPFKGDLTKTEGNEWEVSGCIETHLDEIGKGAGTDAKEGADQVKEAEEDCKKIGDKAGSWYDKAQAKVDKAKAKLEKLEAKLNKQIEKAQKTRDKLKNSCAEQCDKELIWIGGLGEKDCQVTETTTIKCPIWIPKKKEVIDPKCIAKCNKGILKKVSGWAKGKKAALIEKALQVFTKLLEKSQAFLISAKRLFENAEAAKAKLAEMAAKGKELVSKVANFVAENLISIRKLCIKSTLKEGVCFMIDADMTVAGKDIKLEKEEGCFTASWVKDVATKIAKRAFPSLGSIKDKFKQIKDLFSDSEKSQEDISKQEKDVEEADSEEVEDVDGDDDDDSRKRTLRSSDIVMANSRLIDRIGPVPEYVIRNAKSMRVFRDLFFNAEKDRIVMRSDINTMGDTLDDTKSDFDIANILDTLALRRSNKCEKQKAILDMYRGIARSAGSLLNNNRETKRSIDNFTLAFANSFDKMGKDFLRDAQMNNMTDDQINDAMYYVNFGKQGISNMKRRFDAQFTLMDKQSLRQWRAYIEKPFADTDSNLNSLHALLRESSFAASKKWTIPEMKQKIYIADQMVQDLLRKDDTALLTKQATIVRLNSAVNEIEAVGLDPGCSTAVDEEA